MLASFKTLVATGLTLAVGGSLHAATIVSYGGNYATTNRYLPVSSTAFPDVDDRVIRRAFSEVDRLDPVTEYPDTSNGTIAGPAFYGGVQVIVPDGNTTSPVKNPSRGHRITTDDKIFLNGNVPTGAGFELTHHAVIVFLKDGFLSGSAGTDNVGFLLGDSISMNVSDYTNVQQARYVVGQNGSYYVSEATITSGGAKSIDPTQTNWAAYNPASNLNFDENSASFTPLILNNVTALGFYVNQDGVASSATADVHSTFGVKSFSADASVIPEPGSLALLGIGAAGLLRRRSHR